jgi:hypothetical protein
MGKKTVAELLVDTLVSRGVSRINGRGDEIVDLARTNLWR